MEALNGKRTSCRYKEFPVLEPQKYAGCAGRQKYYWETFILADCAGWRQEVIRISFQK